MRRINVNYDGVGLVAGLVFLLLFIGAISWTLYAVFTVSPSEQHERDRQDQQNEERWHKDYLQNLSYADSQAQACKDQGGTPFNLNYHGTCVYDGVVVAEWKIPFDE